MSEVKMYFMGGKGILDPIDFTGKKIKVGDILTGDYFEELYNDQYYLKNWPTWSKEQIEAHKNNPTYIVKYNEKGFFYAEGINQKLYLHDFRFKFTKIVEDALPGL
jgi:hypothetical protein